MFENREDDILETSVTARLLSFPNVIVTSHQGFLTEEALEAIELWKINNPEDRKQMHAYQCSVCHKWHIGHYSEKKEKSEMIFQASMPAQYSFC